MWHSIVYIWFVGNTSISLNRLGKAISNIAMDKLIFAVSLLSATAFASKNGQYYICNTTILASDNECIFAFSGNQPSDWDETVKHNIDRSVGEDFHRGVQNSTGHILHVTPKPWSNGDKLVGTTNAVTGDEWTYALIFELVAPLRDMMMYVPNALTEDIWSAYTRALTDCHIKTDEYTISSRKGGQPLSTRQVYEKLKNPHHNDIHHFILQYLEEGAIELVCLSTNLEMDHCDAIRKTAGADKGDRCDCWFDAYAALYDAPPVVNTTFKTCPFPTDTVGTDEPTDEPPTGTVSPKGKGGPKGKAKPKRKPGLVPKGKPKGKHG